MTYELFLGNRLYFSWSIAAYLMFEHFGLADQVAITVFQPQDEADVKRHLSGLSPARTLPTMRTPEGVIVSDSMAIAEELASRHPDIAFWPRDPAARAVARTLANEMHSSFGGLRGNWPVNLRHAYAPVTPPVEIAAELDRLELIWSNARDVTGATGPWLCGDYCLTDAIFAPMAARLAAYGFDTRSTTKSYVAAHLADPAFRKWRTDGLKLDPEMSKFELDLPQADWPV